MTYLALAALVGSWSMLFWTQTLQHRRYRMMIRHITETQRFATDVIDGLPHNDRIAAARAFDALIRQQIYEMTTQLSPWPWRRTS